MRSFFNRPSWASTGDDSTESDFYRRSQQTYADIVAANRKLRQKVTNGGDDSSEIEEGETIKRRRILHPCENAASYDPVTEPLSEDRPDADVDDTTDNPHGTGSNREYSRISHNHTALLEVSGSVEPMSKATSPDVNDIDSSSSHIFSSRIISTAANRTKREATEDGIIAFCEESEISQKTQERLQLYSLVSNHEVAQGSRSPTQLLQPEAEADNHCNERSCVSPQEDTVVQILITSDIDNTKPLIVRRRMSQSLRDVRLAWCRRQGFGDKMAASVFLTWQGKRLFDVTTCKSLGIQSTIGSDGLWSSNDERGDEGESMHIHVEAVTDDTLASRSRQALSNLGNESICETRESEDDKETNGLIRIVLKSPGLDDFRLKVRGKTQISRIVASFREARRIPTKKELYLLFDGERLSHDSCVEEYDIADLDLVDVQVK